MSIQRDWTDVNAAHRGEPCWVCGGFNAEMAHVTKRERDGRDDAGRRLQGKVRVDPRDVLPLCSTHHTLFDNAQIDILPVLVKRAPEKIIRAVERMGFEQARRRLAPSDYTDVIERARAKVAA